MNWKEGGNNTVVLMGKISIQYLIRKF